jgi:hypothetical protein
MARGRAEAVNSFNLKALQRAFGKTGQRAAGAATLLLGTLLLLWPAIYNGFPLLYPDSMTYLADGAPVARALFLHRFSAYYGIRSLLYSLVIFPFHCNLTAWPVAALQCLLTAWVLWLLVRTLAPRRSRWSYLALMLALSLLSSVSWYASFIMPDVLGPLVYLCFFLLVYAGQSLARWERLSLCILAAWGITAHATHLPLAAGLCLLLALFALCERQHFRLRIGGVAQCGALLALAVGMQIALNAYLFGEPTLNGERPPYLLARVIADGPGKLYLQFHCTERQWAVCAHLESLSDDPDDFLWGPSGIWESSSEAEREQISRQEMPLVKAVLRAYPHQQLQRSAANFRGQLGAFAPYGFDPSPWLAEQFATTLTPARASYLRSRQARSLLPLDQMALIQYWTVMISLGTVVALAALFRLRLGARLWALCGTVLATIAANAALTGILSVVDDRYGCRIIWLLPLLAGILLIEARQRLGAARHKR